MSVAGDIKVLEDICAALSSQTGSLSSSMLANDQESINNLKEMIETAVKELDDGINELKGYLSTMEYQNNYWS